MTQGRVCTVHRTHTYLWCRADKDVARARLEGEALAPPLLRLEAAQALLQARHRRVIRGADLERHQGRGATSARPAHVCSDPTPMRSKQQSKCNPSCHLGVTDCKRCWEVALTYDTAPPRAGASAACHTARVRALRACVSPPAVRVAHLQATGQSHGQRWPRPFCSWP